MSHEFRTPLNHILGFVELMLDKTFGGLSEVQEEFLKDIYDSSLHLRSLINALLEVSKIGANDSVLELTNIDLKWVLENNLSLIERQAAARKVSLSLITDGVPGMIEGDLPKLKQILYPLLANALKFTPEGGRILLSAKRITEVMGDGTDLGNTPRGDG